MCGVCVVWCVCVCGVCVCSVVCSVVCVCVWCVCVVCVCVFKYQLPMSHVMRSCEVGFQVPIPSSLSEVTSSVPLGFACT